MKIWSCNFTFVINSTPHAIMLVTSSPDCLLCFRSLLLWLYSLLPTTKIVQKSNTMLVWFWIPDTDAIFSMDISLDKANHLKQPTLFIYIYMIASIVGGLFVFPYINVCVYIKIYNLTLFRLITKQPNLANVNKSNCEVNWW